MAVSRRAAATQSRQHVLLSRKHAIVAVLCFIFLSFHTDAVHPPVSMRGGDLPRNRFWSLGALFRLNADAKDDALLDAEEERTASLHGRGGALAVRIKTRTPEDVPVSTASARLLPDESINNEQSVMQFDQERDFEIDAIDQEGSDEEESTDSEDLLQAEEDLEQVKTAEDSRDLIDEDTENEETEEQHAYVSSTPTVSVDLQRDDEDDAEKESQTGVAIDERFLDGQSDERAEAEYAKKISPDTVEPEALAQEKTSPLNDASRLWWTNVWTEQTSEDMPDLEEVASKDSDAEISVPEAGDTEIVNEYEVDFEDQAVVEGRVEYDQVETTTDTEKESLLVDDTAAIHAEESEGLIGALAAVSSAEEPDSALQDSIEADSEHVLIEVEAPSGVESPYMSSGYWVPIDQFLSLGLASLNPNLKLSRHLRTVRKVAAHATGLHGFISRKGKGLPSRPENAIVRPSEADAINEEDLGMIQRRIAAIQIAKQNVAKRAAKDAGTTVVRRKGLFRRFRKNNDADSASQILIGDAEISSVYVTLERQSLEDEIEERRRKKRVREIDKLIQKGQQELLDLQCEKDDLQRRPNPLYNYTTATDAFSKEGGGKTAQRTTRKFNFPPQELVDEYLDELFVNGRLEKMNHTHLWKSGAGFDDDEDESIGDDLLTPSADVRKLYETREIDRQATNGAEPRTGNGNGGGGSWLLRQSLLGKGGSLGEKIGEATETAAYKAVCAAVMSALARGISAIHGVNIMTHSDIRLYMEQSPDLPPVGKNVIPGSDRSGNYAQEAIIDAMRRGVHKHKKRASRLKRQRIEEAFLQRDAVVETLISHCQISAPLLKLFPLAWQRALLGNIITLIAAVVSDFCDGIQLQILGHQLSFAFKPITESDMIRHIGMAGNGFNHRRARPEEFEAAVRATAEDVSENLQFLDRWHHRALGSGMLRAQVANLIARIVLTLADEVLSGARMDLWSAQAGGPRMLAGLEYRTTPETRT